MASPVSPSGFIRISRESAYADAVRAYSVWIDGSKVGEIADGGTMEWAGVGRCSRGRPPDRLVPESGGDGAGEAE